MCLQKVFMIADKFRILQRVYNSLATCTRYFKESIDEEFA